MKTRWQTKKLGKVLQIQNGFAFKSSEYTDSGFFVMRITNVQDGIIELNDPKYIKESHKSFKNFFLSENDILMSLTGNVGRIGIIKKEHLPAVLNQRVARLKVSDEGQLDRDFLFYFLRSPKFFNEVVAGGKGMAQQNVSTKDIENLEIPLPSLEVQKEIVAKLDEKFAKLHEAKQLREGAIKDTEKIFSQTLREIFEEGEKKGWEEKLIKDICEHPQYGFTAPSTREPIGPKMLRITDIQDGKVDWNTVPYCKCDDVEKYQLKKNDLVFARTGATVGKSFLITHDPENAIYASYLIRLRAKVNISSEFLYYFFQSPDYWNQITENAVGGAQPNVNGTKLANLNIFVPSIIEQNEIVTRLDELSEKLRTLRELQTKQLADLKKLEKAYLREAFNGELV